MFITFLTDFGLEDDFVGTCHGVMKRLAPEVQIIDVTHGIRPGRVLQGALALANALQYMPVGVHLAIVDPGVGSLVEVRELANPAYALESVSRTFHGRDLFSPAAAYLAAGVALAELGPP